MKKILLFGRTGQILQQLYSILSANNSFQLFSVSRYKPFVSTSLHSVHVTSYTHEIIANLISNLQPDVVIYALAAGSIRSRNDSPEAIKYINLSLPLTISSELLKLEKPTSLIGFGSFAEYGGYTLDSYITKFISPKPITEYAVSKSLVFEKLYDVQQRSPSFKYTHLTLSSVFGGREHSSRLIPKIIHSLIANNPIVISSNPARRDYVFSLDIVNLIESLIHSNYYPNRLICASSSAFSNLEVFRILSDLLHHPDPYSLLSTTSLVSTPTLIGDSKDFQHLLNSNLVTLPEIDLSMYTLS